MSCQTTLQRIRASVMIPPTKAIGTAAYEYGWACPASESIWSFGSTAASASVSQRRGRVSNSPYGVTRYLSRG